MKIKILLTALTGIIIIASTSSCKKSSIVEEKTGIVKITFRNTVKGSPIKLNTETYTNSFSEQYIITKYKYYISNVSVVATNIQKTEKESYHLIDESSLSSLNFTYLVAIGSYNAVSFVLGVDSLRNVSGAQSGALDPTNDMFWTWSTGYVMAKLEGTSPQSSAVNNKIEYHIGGFKGVDNVLKNLTLNFPSGKHLEIKEGVTSEIIIEADLDNWWQNPNDLKIATNPVCAMPGSLAKQISDNYGKMFSVVDVINN